MHPPTHPVAARYTEELRLALAGAGIPAGESGEIEREIASHLAEAVSRGEPLEAALRRLGPARQLAAAYGVELALNPRPLPGRLLPGWRTATTALTRGLSALLIAALGLVGGAAAIVGALGVLAGLITPFLPLEPTLRAGWPQVMVVAASLALATVGTVLVRIFLFTYRLWRGLRAPAIANLEKPR